MQVAVLFPRLPRRCKAADRHGLASAYSGIPSMHCRCTCISMRDELTYIRLDFVRLDYVRLS